MHLARIRVGVRLAAPGIPDLFGVAPERVVETCVEHALGRSAAVRVPGAPGLGAASAASAPVRVVRTSERPLPCTRRSSHGASTRRTATTP